MSDNCSALVFKGTSVETLHCTLFRSKLELCIKLQRIRPSCTTNYLSSINSDRDYPPSITSSGCILQLGKVLSVTVHS